MISKPIKLFLLLLFLLALLPVHAAFADTGPKPTMEFTFKQELAGQPVTITSGIFYECEQSDCSDASPLKELGPQRFTCEANSCHALAYGFSTYHRLEIQFSDGKTRRSNIFQTAGFNSRYTVTIRPDDLLVEAQFSPGILPPIGIIVIPCICALIGVSVLIVVIIFIVRLFRRK
ncbi:MAG TPA: hypothetical protein VK206_28435 [Anaerolineales bacterium]|nr:hypothetical protein [Anaerolineales bacterium]HLO34069.1 hypothetical protein [Anaerolineales bacterium]